ncbi:MAG: hypothetical protein PF569_01990 [Candidatus Woesearchaeota archaeon]|jgi:hypothetical protein|nr:hypothetical protein [Candidatus Woesearchaeota archaeon]
MRKISIIVLILILFGTVFADSEEHNFTEAISLVKSNTNCNDLTIHQLELIGDYYME